MSLLDDVTKLRRYCFLGAFEAVYVYNGRTPIKMEHYFPLLKGYCSSVDGKTIVTLVSEAMPRTIRHDEPLFVYAVYLSTQTNDGRTTARQAFNTIIATDNDLFLFCKYAFGIRKLENKRGMSRTMRKAITSWYEIQTAGDLREMWLNHRGEHGFTHEGLIRLCHVKNSTIGDGIAGNMFFKTCTQLILEDQHNKRDAQPAPALQPPPADELDIVDDAPEEANVENEEAAAGAAIVSKKSGPSSLMLAMSKLRTTKNKNQARKIIRKHKLKYHQVPMSFKQCTAIMELLVPSMSYMTVLKNWHKFGRSDHFKSGRFFKLCREKMENRQLLRSENIHPIVFLIQRNAHNYHDESNKMTPKKMQLYKVKYFNEMYERSFGENTPTGMRMHITINLQDNYKKKLISHQKHVTYFEASIALAYAYYKAEANVDVFYWDDDCTKLQPIEWDHCANIHQAMAYCDQLPNTTKNNQKLTLPLLGSMNTAPVYDIFLAIVPTAGRSNPSNSSDELRGLIDKYNKMKKAHTRYVIVDVLKHRKSMYYSNEKQENILEICGLDENTPKLINQFGLHAFS